MGRHDLYPFVLPGPVLDKMRFIHTIIDEVAAATTTTWRRHVSGTGPYLAHRAARLLARKWPRRWLRGDSPIGRCRSLGITVAAVSDSWGS
jgi:hypothetical protein